MAVILGIALTVAVLAPSALAATYSKGGRYLVRSGYDYTPAMFTQGNLEHHYWCTPGTSEDGLPGDTISYRQRTISTNTWGPIRPAIIRPSKTGWDSRHTCDPSVVQGQFSYGGTSYIYALYYTGNDETKCTDNTDFGNEVGVAYSNNPASGWRKAGTVIRSGVALPERGCASFGVGFPTAYNRDGRGGVDLLFTDTTRKFDQIDFGTYGASAGSYNGRTFSTPKRISFCGRSRNTANMDLGYDGRSGYAYIADAHSGPSGTQVIDVWRVNYNALRAGNGQWQRGATIGLPQTGDAYNLSPGWQRDVYGNITPYLNSPRIYMGAGSSSSGSWDLEYGNVNVSSGWTTSSENC